MIIVSAIIGTAVGMVCVLIYLLIRKIVNDYELKKPKEIIIIKKPEPKYKSMYDEEDYKINKEDF